MGVVGGGLVIGVTVNRFLPKPPPFVPVDGALAPNAFLQITPEGKVTFYLPVQEMGQGVHTGLTTLIAEELSVSPEDINVVQSGVHPDYKNPDFGMQGTGGSTSMRLFFQPIRQAAANAGAVLKQAAAQQLGVDVDKVDLNDGSVFANGNRYPLGEFVGTATTLPVPESAPLKSAENFQYIGKQNARLDAVEKSTGKADFGIDVEIPNLHRAVIVRCPVTGGSPIDFTADEAKSMPGVKQVVALSHGVAVVAETYWQAQKSCEHTKH